MNVKGDPFAWQPPGMAASDRLVDTRRSLHLAAQAAANLGRCYLPAPEDYSHISLSWQPRLGALAGQPVAGGTGSLRAALRFDPLEWLLLDAGGEPALSIALAGKTLAVLEAEVRAALGRMGLDAGRYTLKPPFQVEPHPLLDGAAFAPEADAAARRELASYYAGAHRLLSGLAFESGLTDEPRCWPHHFDYALLLKLGPGSHDDARSIGLGMSPGDGYYAQPYFYATPWPYPAGVDLPPLTAPAFWHRQEWTGAVLRSSDLPRDAGQRVAAYWREARTALTRLLTA